jgi:hypothetical protein
MASRKKKGLHLNVTLLDSRLRGNDVLERLMFCAFDDLILKIFANVYKIITVAGNPHDEVPVFFWLLLGLPEGVCVDHVKLNMVTIELEV